jgi:hypothetical protein
MHLEWIDEQDAAGNWKRSRLELNGRTVAGIMRTIQTPLVKAPLRWYVESVSGNLTCNGEAHSLDMVSMLQAMIEQMVTTEHQYSHTDDSDESTEQEHAHQ